MSKSFNDTHGKRINGEITGHLGRVRLKQNGNIARCHDDNVGSPVAKKFAKKQVVRARRRLPILVMEGLLN